VKRLGIKDLHFHDLRHDAASTLTMAGVSQRAVMAMLGHPDPRMSVRCQHLSPEHLHDAPRALDTRPHQKVAALGLWLKVLIVQDQPGRVTKKGADALVLLPWSSLQRVMLFDKQPDKNSIGFKPETVQ